MAVYAGNVTKVRAGGSGDNVVKDGYIKTVEKVWIDSYTITATITTASSIVIAKIPKGKKITDIIVYMPPVSDKSGTAGSVQIDTGSTAKITGTVSFLGTLVAGGGAASDVTTFINSTGATLRLSGDKIGTVAPIDIDIHLKLDNAQGVVQTVTGGTIRTIVKYT